MYLSIQCVVSGLILMSLCRIQKLLLLSGKASLACVTVSALETGRRARQGVKARLQGRSWVGRQDLYETECDARYESGVVGRGPWHEVWERNQRWEQKGWRGKGVGGKR